MFWLKGVWHEQGQEEVSQQSESCSPEQGQSSQGESAVVVEKVRETDFSGILGCRRAQGPVTGGTGK